MAVLEYGDEKDAKTESIAAGETVTITRISGKDEIRQHLADLGFVVEAKVLIISQMGGNLIVQVKGSRVALDRSMAERIFF